MSVVSNNILAGASGQGGATGYAIERSLRFNSGDSAYLNRTPSAAGNRRTWTWSGWIKKYGINTQSFVLAAGTTENAYVQVYFSTDQIVINTRLSGQGWTSTKTGALYRDPASWFHLIIAMDTTATGNSGKDRLKLYVNGTLLGDSDYSTDGRASIGVNTELEVNSTVGHFIGKQGSANTYANFSLADVHFIDGQALAPTDFGETDDNGVWQPKKVIVASVNDGTVWSNNSTGTFDSTYPKTNAFDGNLSTVTYSNNSDDARFNFSNITITQTNRLRVYGASGWNNLHSIFSNGSSQTWNNQTSQWHDLTDLFTTPWSFDQYKTTNNGNLNAIEIGGEILIDNYNNSTGYGTNGFHLPFSDNSSNAALGTDTSGNSNTWTVNNLTASVSGNTFQALKSNGSSWGNPDNAFDGSTSTYADGTYNNGTTSTLTFGTPLTNVTSLRAYWGGTSGYGYNSTTIGSGPSSGSPGYVTLYSGSAITVNNIIGVSSSGDGVVRLYAVEVNGSVLTGYSTALPSDIDSLRDSPSQIATPTDTGAGGEVVGNYCTLNPLDNGTGKTYSNGNLEVSDGGSGANSSYGTLAASSGKWYWEIESGGVAGEQIGFADANAASGRTGNGANGWVYEQAGRKVNNNSYTSYGTSYADGDIIGIALDIDAGSVTFYKNGASQGVAFTGLSGKTLQPLIERASGYGMSWTANFGQRAFKHPLAGYKSLCTSNLPEPSIPIPSQYFDTKVWTGDGNSTRSISNYSFSPDFVWIKNRTTTGWQHVLYDQIRGAGTSSVTKSLSTDSTRAEASGNDTNHGYLSGFTSDGFDLTKGSQSGGDYVNHNNWGYVGWSWDAGDSTVTNNDGSIASQVRAQPSAGFSICTYTGNNTAGASVGHGLNAAVEFLIVKSRGQSGQYWHVWHSSLANNEYIYLNATSPKTSGNDFLNGTAPGNSVFTLGSGNACNKSGDTVVAYCFAPVEGYSAMGSYVGNGSFSGPFVYTGFKVSFVMIKVTSTTNNWVIFDAARDPHNKMSQELYPDNSNAEATVGFIDFLSNGFRLNTEQYHTNQSGQTFVYLAFASNPFKTARAR